MSPPPLRAFLVDDEPLALKRLGRLLAATGRVEIAGSAADPEAALAFLSHHDVDVLFLDIQMPGMDGFELLSRLPAQPMVVFTTAYDQYALKAFEVNSIDYLLKPVEAQQLERALKKLERSRGAAGSTAAGRAPAPQQEWMRQPEFRDLLAQLSAALRAPQAEFPDRVASRVGERVQFIEMARVTHFFAQDKLTFAAAGGKAHSVDFSIAELEQKLDPKKWVRIHRGTLLNLAWVQELDAWFGGRALVRLKDEKRTELTVARDRVRALKERLGL